MIQVGYKTKKNGEVVVKLGVVNLDIQNVESEFNLAKNFLYEKEALFNQKDTDFIKKTFYSIDDQDVFTVNLGSNMLGLRKTLENYLVENNEKFIFTLIYDEEDNEIKPFFTIYNYDENNATERKGACMFFDNISTLIRNLKKDEALE